MNREEWSPGILEDGYQAALDAAWSAVMRKDLKAQARHAGGIYDDDTIVLPTFGRECSVDLADRKIAIGSRSVKPLGAILVLHYLAGVTEVRPSGRTVSYRQLPGGNVYYGAFRARVIEPIGGMFHHQPQLLLSAMKGLGARKLELGDASVLIPVFPKLPVTVIIWRGDDEVRGTANVLFDDSAPRFLSTEDLAAVGTFVVSQLVKVHHGMVDEVRNVNTL